MGIALAEEVPQPRALSPWLMRCQRPGESYLCGLMRSKIRGDTDLCGLHQSPETILRVALEGTICFRSSPEEEILLSSTNSESKSNFIKVR